MKHTKFQVNWYQASDTAAMERKLERMAQRGWLLDKLTNWGFRYVRSEPQQVRYCVTFFPQASVFDAGLTEGQQTYADYCAVAGWHLVGNWGPLQIFRSTRDDPTPIETDEGEKLRAIHRSMLKTHVFSYGLLLAVWIMNFFLRLAMLRRSPLSFLSSNQNLMFLLFLLFFIAYLAYMLLDHFVWYFRSKRAVERGGNCLPTNTALRYWLSMALLALCVIMLLVTVAEATTPGRAWILAYSFGGIATVMAVSQLILHGMKKRGFSRGVTRAAFIVAAVVLSAAYAAALPALVLRLSDAGLMEEHGGPEIITDADGDHWELYRHELPLTLEELGYTVAEEDACSYEAEVERSVLMEHGVYYQRAYGTDSDLPWLTYQVVTSEQKWVLDLCWKYLRTSGGRYTSSFESTAVDPTPFGAEDAFFDRFPNGYCLRYEDCIIIMDQGEELTEAERAEAARRLAAMQREQLLC